MSDAKKIGIAGGRRWTEVTRPNGLRVWDSECGDFQILATKVTGGRFREFAFQHDPSPQFPDCEFWMRECDSLHLAMHYAECM